MPRKKLTLGQAVQKKIEFITHAKQKAFVKAVFTKDLDLLCYVEIDQ
jgi:hypothetical protein